MRTLKIRDVVLAQQGFEEAKRGDTSAEAAGSRRLDHFGGHDPRFPDCGDEHVRLGDVPGEVDGPRMADRHGRVRAQEEQRRRLADDRAPPDHNRARTLQRDVVLLWDKPASRSAIPVLAVRKAAVPGVRA